MLAKVDNCLDVLVKSKRMAEATIFARAYAPSRLGEMIPLWTEYLKENNFPFQPDDITKAQEELISAEIEKETLMRQELYDQPKQPASQLSAVKQTWAQF